MKINAFFPNLPNGENFANILSKDLTSEDGELFLVCAEYQRPGHIEKLGDFKGLDVALTLNPEEAPIIFCSFMPERYFTKRDEFSTKYYALLAKKRVDFIQLPFTSDDLLKKYKELMSEKKTEDLLAIELNNMSEYEKAMGTIQHSISGSEYNLGHPKAIEAIGKARNIGVTGSDEEVLSQIKSFRYYARGNKKFSGKFLPGVFCDIEDTLIKDGKINIEMLEILKEHSKTLPITLWSGAALELPKIAERLKELNILWKFVPKFIFEGAEVEMAYDNEDQETLFKKYGFNVRNFIKVS